jgi:multicomponent Na+:H+ antiporter subunit F
MNAWVIDIVYLILSLSLLMAFIRLARGPSLPDRVVALELIASIVVGMIGIHAIDTGVDAYIDIAIVLALTAFLAAIGFARFVQVKGQHDE